MRDETTARKAYERNPDVGREILALRNGFELARWRQSLTGNHTTFQFRNGWGRAYFKVKVTTARVTGRSGDAVTEVRTRFLVALEEHMECVRALREDHKAICRAAGSNAWWSAEDVLIDEVARHVPEIKDVRDAVVRAVLDARGSDGLLDKARRHQRELAADELRPIIAKALRNGSTVEELHALVDEALVSEIMGA